MKAILGFAAITFAYAGIGAAQERVTVPLSNPSQPATLRVRLISGSITVTSGSAPEVVVESRPRVDDIQSALLRGRHTGRDNANRPPGMHRLDTGGGGLNVEEDNNTVSIGGIRPDRSGDLTIQVPLNTSVQLRTIGGGNIDVSQISGDIDVENISGAITLTAVSGSIVAHTLNGVITASLDRVPPNKPMSFTSLNGKIDVTLPADAKARLRLKTYNGAIYTDFDVTMQADGAKPKVEDARGQGGKYRIRLDRGAYGSINGGGPEYVFQTFNGSIYIHKK